MSSQNRFLVQVIRIRFASPRMIFRESQGVEILIGCDYWRVVIVVFECRRRKFRFDDLSGDRDGMIFLEMELSPNCRRYTAGYICPIVCWITFSSNCHGLGRISRIGRRVRGCRKSSIKLCSEGLQYHLKKDADNWNTSAKLVNDRFGAQGIQSMHRHLTRMSAFPGLWAAC